MSTLEKTIGLLETMSDHQIEAVYAFVRFINSDTYELSSEPSVTKQKQYNPCSESLTNMLIRH